MVSRGNRMLPKFGYVRRKLNLLYGKAGGSLHKSDNEGLSISWISKISCLTGNTTLRTNCTQSRSTTTSCKRSVLNTQYLPPSLDCTTVSPIHSFINFMQKNVKFELLKDIIPVKTIHCLTTMAFCGFIMVVFELS